MRRKGFTLIEILVVISVIAILMALVIPILGKVGEKAKRTTCASLISDLSRGAESFAACFGYYPRDYLDGFSYTASDSGTEEEQVRRKSSAVLLLALTHSFIDHPELAKDSPARGKGPFFDDLRLGENIVRYEPLDYPQMSPDPRNPYAFSFLTYSMFGYPEQTGRPAFLIIDPWGRALVYDEKRAYYMYVKGRRTQNNSYEEHDYVGVSFTGGDALTDPAYRMPFVLYSLGPNGSDDTDKASSAGEVKHGDDIGNW